MHTDNLEILRKEALRLIELESQLLSSMQETQGLLSAHSDTAQSFDTKSLMQSLEVLSGEHHKLDLMDMVVAVVGTMKAGKSTTINAIVGSEILPNRNGPMTSIPTLIRHAKGKNTPSVTFENNGPINELCRSLLNALDSSPAAVARLYEESSDMANVIDFIRSGEELKSYYEGQKGIFEFLKLVNDLVRICRELEHDFPFSDYDEMHELPVIEVEFTSLSEKESGLGTLTLLDTPGPNEAGQQHLKVMLKDQLRKASAVVTVLNYTQLKSESDEDLRNEVNAIADIAKGRMYAFVNKFDQRSYNDPDDESSVKKMVSNLLSGSIPEESIFAVSAQKAFLGEVIQKFIKENGALPNPEEHPWVEEFARDCFGRHWQEKLNDTERVLEEARVYWEESGFVLPLEKVVHAAHQNAAYYALDSTASKLVSLAERISNFVSGRETALRKTAIELQGYIAELKSDVERISQLRDSKEKQSEQILDDLKRQIETCLSEIISEASGIVDELFTKGEIESEKKRRDLANASTKKKVREGKHSTESVKKKTMAGMFGLDVLAGKEHSQLSAGCETERLETKKRHLEFATHQEAREFVSRFEIALKPPVKRLNKSMSIAVSEALKGFDEQLRSSIALEAGHILNEITERLGQEGFDITLRLPADIRVDALSLGGLSMKDGIKESSKTVTRLQEQDTVFGWLKRGVDIFGGDWGYDEVEENIEVFKVSLNKLNTQTRKLIDAQGLEWRDEVEKEVEEPIRSTLSNFFDELEAKVEVVRGDLLQGIEDKEKSQNEQAELLGGLQNIAKNVPGIVEDSEGLKGDAHHNLEERQR